ncbi:uncharacterized protein LOC128249821 [Octopus bimaculoides]|uniref:uncharacterized protein LOC128249821 n=1 Tax=Octopus bimaculoides TaxID=37653 RepID=UPI0022E93547|nr:uncharacterized protein LOC128249821 [Octopus bimaculoides]
MLLFMVIPLLFIGDAVAEDCEELAWKHCPYSYNMTYKEDPHCWAYTSFYECFRRIDEYCTKYFKFKNYNICGFLVGNSSQRNQVVFQSVLFSVAAAIRLIQISINLMLI